MRIASSVTTAQDGQTKQFSAEEFRKVMNSSHFVGAVAFWRSLESLAQPEPQTRLHAMGVLRELARKSFDDCLGLAYSPQQAECLAYWASSRLASAGRAH
jgi:hypothetical protein